MTAPRIIIVTGSLAVLAACGPLDRVEGACSPLSCSQIHAGCGAVSDGCGGVIDCGSCNQPPPACIPDDEATLCYLSSTPCGTAMVTDNCGAARTIGCGVCPVSPGAWQSPAFLDEPLGQGYSSAGTLIADGFGGVLALWQQRVDQDRSMWSRKLNGGSWSAPVRVAYDAGSYLNGVTDDSYNTWIIWSRSDSNVVTSVVVQVFDGTDWSAPTALATVDWNVGGNVSNPRLVATGDRVLATWITRKGTESQLHSRWYEPATGWGPDEILATDPLYANRVAVDAGGGEAIVVWSYDIDADDLTVRSRRWSDGAWADAETILTRSRYRDNSTWFKRLFVSLDVNAHARVIVFHVGSDYGFVDIAETHAVPGSPWSPLAGVHAEIDVGWFQEPEVAANRYGEIAIAWREVVDEESTRMMALRLAPDSGWSEPEVIAADMAPPYFGCAEVSAYAHDVDINDDGVIAVAFEDKMAEWQLTPWVTRFVPGSGWQPVVEVSDNTSYTNNPQVLSTTGHTVVAWDQQEWLDEGSVRGFFANWFVPGS